MIAVCVSHSKDDLKVSACVYVSGLNHFVIIIASYWAFLLSFESAKDCLYHTLSMLWCARVPRRRRGLQLGLSGSCKLLFLVLKEPVGGSGKLWGPLRWFFRCELVSFFTLLAPRELAVLLLPLCYHCCEWAPA